MANHFAIPDKTIAPIAVIDEPSGALRYIAAEAAPHLQDQLNRIERKLDALLGDVRNLQERLPPPVYQVGK